MADGSGSGGIGLLGVVIGAIIVGGLGYVFFVNNPGGGSSTNVKIEVPKGK